jgi:flavorubredoxin
MSDKLKEGGFQLLNDGIREKWSPNMEAVENCIRFGKDFALKLK